MSGVNYLNRVQGIAKRHLEFTLNLDRRWQREELATALRANRLAIAEGLSVVNDGLSAYQKMDRVIHMAPKLMDYCWHCPLCDVTMAIDATPEQIQELKASVASGDSYTVHDVDGGEPHLLQLIQARH